MEHCKPLKCYSQPTPLKKVERSVAQRLDQETSWLTQERRAVHHHEERFVINGILNILPGAHQHRYVWWRCNDAHWRQSRPQIQTKRHTHTVLASWWVMPCTLIALPPQWICHRYLLTICFLHQPWKAHTLYYFHNIYSMIYFISSGGQSQ